MAACAWPCHETCGSCVKPALLCKFLDTAPMAGARGSPPPMAPLIVLMVEGRGRKMVARAPDADGWMKVESRWKRQERRRQAYCPRRPVPTDLRGRCFNCFAFDHRAASCRSKPRCFRCRALGHRSSDCLLRAGKLRSEVPHPPRLIWRPKSTPGRSGATPTAAAPTTLVDGQGSSQGRERRRRHRRKRPKRPEFSADEDTRPSPVASSEDERPVLGAVPSRPRKILDRSASISQREDSLARALVITVISGSPDSILPTIASRFEVEVSLMSLQCFGEARFLLILPSSAMAERVYDGERAFTSPTLRLNVMRWTRLINSQGASLPEPVEVDTCGIPAHAWELATAELILSDHCWIGGVHPDTADHQDVFRVVAWSSFPSRIPGSDGS